MFKKNIKISTIFLVPVLIVFLFEIITDDFTFNRSFNLIENLLFLIVIIILSLFFGRQQYRKWYFFVAFTIFNLSLFFESFYNYHFKGVLNDSAIFVILETNMAESSEFLSSYFNKPILILLIILVFANSIGLVLISRYTIALKQSINRKVVLILTVFLIMAFLKITKLIMYNVPYLVIRTPISYYKEIQRLKLYGEENPFGSFNNVKHLGTDKNKELYVIVLGESTSELHFNLHSEYYRETTPLLNKIKNELCIIEDAISPHAYTIGSLSKALTLGNYENPLAQSKGSILQLLNQAGFKTYWISNQRPVGISDTHITKIAKGADVIKFLNVNHTSERTPYDELLLDELDSVLLEEGNKKVVFMHMIGAHFAYEKRFPPKFKYFRTKPKTKFERQEVYETINAYDNVMRYTDSILNEVIVKTRKQQVKSFMLYFSDHGQEVYDDIDFFGHSVDQMVTKNMFKIPLFLWSSENYQANRQLIDNSKRKYMIDDMIHTIADLCNVSSDEIDLSRSIFNSKFKDRTRFIKDSIDFDTYFD
ncbi:phosphoethanolamine transferase [Cognatitamlana onchidii]|uniref:phosphoethanolamine transferase n=1 Tax=Cognatitamlana onchidii TaxID=2562860 RepID=UPI0010A671A0|nr:phosphoethanolamine transferase [Algibacter onchidii]